MHGTLISRISRLKHHWYIPAIVLLSSVNFHIQPITKLCKFQIRDDEPPEIKEDDGTARNTELEKVW